LIADVRAEAQHEQLIALADEVEILVTSAREAEPNDRLAGSYALMTMTAVLAAGWLMERLGRAIDSGEGESGNSGRRAAIEYFLSVIVPEALGLGAAVETGAELLFRAPAEELA